MSSADRQVERREAEMPGWRCFDACLMASMEWHD